MIIERIDSPNDLKSLDIEELENTGKGDQGIHYTNRIKYGWSPRSQSRYRGINSCTTLCI